VNWHTIKKQILEIQCSKEDLGFQISQRASELLKTKIASITEKVFDELNQTSQTFKIPKLEIDIGTINSINWESDFLFRYEQMLRKELNERITETIILQKISPNLYKSVHSKLELLEFYLEKGFLPWWFESVWNNIPSPKTYNPFSLKKLIISLAKYALNETATWLKANVKNSTISQRLSSQLSDKEIREVLTQLNADKWLIDFYRDLKAILKNTFENTNVQDCLPIRILLEVFKKGKNSKPALRNSFVKEILEEMLSPYEQELFWSTLTPILRKTKAQTRFLSQLDTILNSLRQEKQVSIILQTWQSSNHWKSLTPWLSPTKSTDFWEILFPRQSKLLNTLVQNLIKLPWAVGYPRPIVANLSSTPRMQVQAYLLALLWEKKPKVPSEKELFKELITDLTADIPYLEKEDFLKKSLDILPQYRNELNEERIFPNQLVLLEELRRDLVRLPWPTGFPRSISPNMSTDIGTQVQSYLLAFLWEMRPQVPDKSAFFTGLLAQMTAEMTEPQREDFLNKSSAILSQYQKEIRNLSTQKPTIILRSALEWKTYLSTQEDTQGLAELKKINPRQAAFIDAYVKDLQRFLDKEVPNITYSYIGLVAEVLAILQRQPRLSLKSFLNQHLDQVKAQILMLRDVTFSSKGFIAKVTKAIPSLKPYALEEPEEISKKEPKPTQSQSSRLDMLAEVLARPETNPFIILRILLEGQDIPLEIQLRDLHQVHSLEQRLMGWIKNEPQKFEELVRDANLDLSNLSLPYFSEKFRQDFLKKIKDITKKDIITNEFLDQDISKLLAKWSSKVSSDYNEFRQNLKPLLPRQVEKLISLIVYFLETDKVFESIEIDKIVGEELLTYFSKEFPREFHWWVEALSEKLRQKAEKTQPQLIQEAVEEILKQRNQAKMEKIKKAFSQSSLETKAIIPLTEVYIQNAGLVLLNPFLGRLFSRLNYIENRVFKSNETAERGVHLLQYILNKSEKSEEYELAFNKLLCGLPISMSVAKEITLSDEEKEMAESLLLGVIQNWSVLKNTTPDALRASFLMREGKLSEYGQHWQLQVASKGIDVLLAQLPWGISTFKLNWMDKIFQVDWTTP